MSNWYQKSGFYPSQQQLEPSQQPIQHLEVVQTSAPTLTIITSAELKNYLKLGSDTTDDNLIADITEAAQAMLEQSLGGYCLVEQAFSQYQVGGTRYLELERRPVFGIPTVSYYEDFDTVTATNITYSTHFKTVGDRLYHVDGYWPTGREGDGYIVVFKAGKYTAGNVSNADPALKLAVKRLGAFLYENREEFVVAIKEGPLSVTYDLEADPVGIKHLAARFHNGAGII